MLITLTRAASKDPTDAHDARWLSGPKSKNSCLNCKNIVKKHQGKCFATPLTVDDDVLLLSRLTECAKLRTHARLQRVCLPTSHRGKDMS